MATHQPRALAQSCGYLFHPQKRPRPAPLLPVRRLTLGRVNAFRAPHPTLGRCGQESFVYLTHSLPPEGTQGISVSQETDTKPESWGQDGASHLTLVLHPYPVRSHRHAEHTSDFLHVSGHGNMHDLLEAQSRSVGVSTPGANLSR